MFELLDAYRSILHFAEWSGLSVGALAGLAALAWFGWEIPIVRQFVAVAAVVVAAGYAGLIHGGAVERRDVLAQWAEADRKKELAAKQHDADVEAAIRAAYLPDIANLQRQLDDNQRQADLNVHSLLGQGVGSAGGRCQLGDEPLRLRGAARAK